MEAAANASSPPTSSFSSSPLASIVPSSLAPILAHIIPSSVASHFAGDEPVFSVVSSSWKTVALTLFLGYVLLCRALRYRREASMRRKFGYPDRASLARMTTEDAQLILRDLLTLEFPQFAVTALQFGLFKVRFMVCRSRLCVCMDINGSHQHMLYATLESGLADTASFYRPMALKPSVVCYWLLEI